MKQDKSAAAQALSLAAGWCVCCLLGYLLLRQLTVLATGWYLQHWLAGPGAGAGRARVPAQPMNSVLGRELRVVKFGKEGPGAGGVRARVPAKPMNSVFGREPRAAEF